MKVGFPDNESQFAHGTTDMAFVNLCETSSHQCVDAQACPTVETHFVPLLLVGEKDCPTFVY